MNEFATRMKYADSHVPSTAIQSVARCSRGESRFQPKIHTPRNVASRKNAARPSIASGAPKTLPTNVEYTDQFIPNWNSCTKPGRDADREVDQKQRPEEMRQPQPALVARAVPHRLHHRHDRPQPQRQRHEEEVVDRRRRELRTRQVHHVGGNDGHHGERDHPTAGGTARR